MATKMFEVQQSIFQQLQASEAFTQKVTGLYDFVPENTPLPYTTFGRIVSVPLNTKVENGEVVTVTIDVWSEAKGRKETVEILVAIEDALKKELNLTNADLIGQKVSNREVWEEAYGLFTGQIDIEVKLMWEEF